MERVIRNEGPAGELKQRTAVREKVKPSDTPSILEHQHVPIEHVLLDTVRCDFIQREDFLTLLSRWMDSDGLHHIVTLNPEMIVEARENGAFRSAVQAAELRVPDGAGLVWARWYLRSARWAVLPSLVGFSFHRAERIPGVEIVEDLARLCNEHRAPLYLLGGARAQINGTARMLQDLLPELHIRVSSPHIFDLEGPESIIRDIVHTRPAVLLVAYGAPKQTIWIERHRHELAAFVRIAVGVGGAFAMLSEETPRAPRWLRAMNMEWGWRLLLEPTRLPRIWNAVVRFPALIRRQKQGE